MLPARAALLSLALLAAAPAAAQQVPAEQIAAQAEAMRQLWRNTAGKPVNLQLPLFGAMLRFSLPAQYLIKFQGETPDQFLVEYAPDGQSLEDWQSLLTVRAWRGIGAANMTSAAVADRLFHPRKDCPEDPVYRTLGEKPLAAGVTITTVAFGCAALPKGAYPAAQAGAGEQDFLWLLRDSENFYAIKFSQRGPAWQVDEPPIPLAEAEAQLARFGPPLLCAAAEPAPGCADVLALQGGRAAPMASPQP